MTHEHLRAGGIMKNWELVVDKLRAEGWTVQWFSFIERDSRVLWRVNAHKEGGPHFTIQADNLDGAFAGMESVCREEDAPSDRS